MYIEIFNRDLGKLKTEIESYKDEKQLWKIKNEISNSGGNLVLHLCGNLRNYIGAKLGNTGYVRNRDAEFNLKDVPISELIAEVEKTKDEVLNTLNKLTDEDLQKIYPENVIKKEMTTSFFLSHLTTHLNYHLGQINYHRRMISE